MWPIWLFAWWRLGDLVVAVLLGMVPVVPSIVTVYLGGGLVLLAGGYVGMRLILRLGNAMADAWIPVLVSTALFWAWVALFAAGTQSQLASRRAAELIALVVLDAMLVLAGAWLASRRPTVRALAPYDPASVPHSGSATVGLDGPVLGASAMITIDGIAEREGGQTPTPPPFSLAAATIGIAVMFVLGGVLLYVMERF
jgi:hypothetical protein